MRILAKVYYRGTNYAGWQKQPNVLSIQEVIETNLSKYFSNTPITIYGSGRTDAGVHAYGQTFHFDVDVKELDIDRLLYSINQMLPDDIKITDMYEVDDDFHARYSAKSKTYEYTILIDSKDPFLYDRVWLHPNKIDIDKLRETLSYFVGKHNFKNFTSKEEDEDNVVREIYDIDVNCNGDVIYITLTGNGFMRYMVRYIVGTAVKICDKDMDPLFVEDYLDENSERHIVDSKAPACGLALFLVNYE